MGASASFTAEETLNSLQFFYESFIASQSQEHENEKDIGSALMLYQKGEEEAIDTIFYGLDVTKDEEISIPDIDTIEEKNLLLNGDCAGISSLEPFFAELRPKVSKFARFGLVLSNNQINDTQFSSVLRDSCVLMTTGSKLTYLSLAGNGITDITSVLGTHLGEIQEEGEDIVTRLQNSISLNMLLVLDLSYIEDLNFGQQCPPFMGSPLLRRLVLDGCGLSSTVLGESLINVDAVIGEEEGKSVFTHSALTCSLFFGLVSLQELSLNENPLNDVTSLAGLLYFRNAKLQDLSLKDTPLRETTALSLQVNSELSTKIVGATLQSIDGKNIITSAKLATDVKLSHVSVGISSAENDNADKEFTQALKGEQDTTIVA